MKHPTISLIERRVSANHFDASFTLTNAEIERLVDLATRAPTAYNFQNWQFVAVRGTQSKERLRALAYGQTKVTDGSGSATTSRSAAGFCSRPGTITSA